MRVLGRGIAALIRDVDIDSSNANEANNASDETVKSNLTPPELRARIREQLAPIFHDDTATIARKIESITHPLRNDLTLSSLAHLRGGKLHDHDTKRMNAFRKGPKP